MEETLSPRDIAHEAGRLVHHHRPAAAIGGVRVKFSDGRYGMVRHPAFWPDETAPELELHLPASVLCLSFDEARPAILAAVFLALADAPDRERCCPLCLKPYGDA